VGEGRVRLLELVDELGSLRRAVDRLGMSYRSAWGYFRELEAVAGVTFLERPDTRDLRAGVRLTAEGRRFLRRFRRFELAVDAAARREFARAFAPQARRRR
jgi:molybdate transport repressor ModE-like protein